MNFCCTGLDPTMHPLQPVRCKSWLEVTTPWQEFEVLRHWRLVEHGFLMQHLTFAGPLGACPGHGKP